MSDYGNTQATIEDLVAAVREIAAESPNFVYTTPTVPDGSLYADCVYVHEGRGSCLLGQAALKVGLIDASIENTELNTATFSRLCIDLASLSGIVADKDDLVDWLNNVQDYQDSAESWGFAVAEADALREASDWPTEDGTDE